MKNEFALAFNEVLEEKGLPKETILEALSQALVSAYRKSVNASNAQDIKARINLEIGDFAILVEKEVVESVESDLTEVTLENARVLNPDAELGDIVMVDSTPEDFGRVAAQQARQVIQQKIRDAENLAQVNYFDKQLGEIISGIVQATNAQGLTIGLDLNAEGIMPRKEMIPREHFRIHDRVRAVVAEIKESGRGPQIILSRTHRDFLRRLLENEVPEIFHGVVEIRSISREPGQRAKVAVSATQQGIDPVGACVGMRGVRIQTIVRELHDEKIDVIEWNSDPTIFISKAISPARVNGVYLRETVDGQKNALVIVPEDQLSLAIGRDGQNARLAAKLTGWRIDIKSLPESISDWLFNLQNSENLKEIATEEAEAIAQAEEIMGRKAEGRIISTDEYDSLAAFNDRLERRSVRKQQEKFEKYQKLHKEAFDSIPKGAFEMGIDGTGLTLNLQEALIEAGYDNAGKLVLASKMNPDSLLDISGIGPKTLERIIEFAEELPNLVPQVEEEVIEQPAAEAIIQPVETAASEEQDLVLQEIEAIEETATSEKEPVVGAGEELVSDVVDEQPSPEKEMSFDEIFSLKPEVFEPAETDDDEDEGDDTEDSNQKSTKKKKKTKKAGRFRTLEYDPDKDVTVAKKKHKRGDGESWEEI